MNAQMASECRELLDNGVAALQLNLDNTQCNSLMLYLDLLIKWNAVYNLTSVRNPVEMVKQHLLDSLTAASAFTQAKSILDVGSGGGLPGIVLSIVFCDKKITLIDTVNKKTAFLRQVKAELGLKNVSVMTGRVEEFKTDEKFDVITSRAFSELANFVNWAGHLLTVDGEMVALKGQLPQNEIESLPPEWKIKKVTAINVPGLDAQRHLIWLTRR